MLVSATTCPVAGRWSRASTVSPASSPITGARAAGIWGAAASMRTISGAGPWVTPSSASPATAGAAGTSSAGDSAASIRGRPMGRDAFVRPHDPQPPDGPGRLRSAVGRA